MGDVTDYIHVLYSWGCNFCYFPAQESMDVTYNWAENTQSKELKTDIFPPSFTRFQTHLSFHVKGWTSLILLQENVMQYSNY